LSHYAESHYLMRILEIGTERIGYRLKEKVGSVDVLTDTLTRINDGEIVIEPVLAKRLVDRPRGDKKIIVGGRGKTDRRRVLSRHQGRRSSHHCRLAACWHCRIWTIELPVFDGSMLRAALTISKPGLAVTPAEHAQQAVARARTGLDELLDRFRVIARGVYPTVLRALPTALSTNWRPICADRCAWPEVCPSDWSGRSNRGPTTWRPRRCTGSLAGSAAPHIRPPREPWGTRPRYWPGPARELLAQVGTR
jgi:hypothetical protein